ncbi:MAG: 3-methyladenine DNA glycosylase [Beutenbergiaceae bacterium]
MRTSIQNAVLPAASWHEHARTHAERVDALVADHLHRRQNKKSHPVHDFLFTYYSYRPSQLRRWHPGYGITLVDAEEFTGLRGYEVTDDAAAVTSEFLTAQQDLIGGTHALLTATAGRAANTGCFGLHEWAMVYRTEKPRHDLPLRLGSAGTDTVVRSHRIACSHFDAYRFFTDAARERNTLRPGRDDRVEFEQPGCLHAGMDLYKHAFRLSPLIRSELIADCFELAREIRILDVRASPYDVTSLGYPPVPIETAQGKREYAAAQQAFSQRATPLRSELIGQCERLMATLDQAGATTVRPAADAARASSTS